MLAIVFPPEPELQTERPSQFPQFNVELQTIGDINTVYYPTWPMPNALGSGPFVCYGT